MAPARSAASSCAARRPTPSAVDRALELAVPELGRELAAEVELGRELGAEPELGLELVAELVPADSLVSGAGTG